MIVEGGLACISDIRQIRPSAARKVFLYLLKKYWSNCVGNQARRYEGQERRHALGFGGLFFGWILLRRSLLDILWVVCPRITEGGGGCVVFVGAEA